MQLNVGLKLMPPRYFNPTAVSLLSMKPMFIITYHGELGHGDGSTGAVLAEKNSNIYQGLIHNLNLEVSL